MIGQIIDDKKDCFGIYCNGEFIYDRVPISVRGTWNWSHHLVDHDIDYAYLYANGQRLVDVAPEHLKLRLEVREKKIRAFLKSFVNARINIDEICLFDIIPDNHLRHYLELKNEICEYIFDNCSRPKNYTFLSQTYEMTREIALQEVRINWELLKKFASSDTKAMNLSKRIWNTKPTVNYNIFGSITGRLATNPGSFPILNLKSENRGIVIPKWDHFVELDYNAAEVRTLLSLSGKEQPKEDIHEWNTEHIFNGECDRAAGKRKFLSWLYNPNSGVIQSEHYNRTDVLESHYKDGVVSTPFGRDIESDDFHALNYLLQSSSSDNCLTQVNKIHRFLRDRKSNVAFIIHDSVVIDLHHNDRYLIPQIKEIFEDTRLGNFPSGIKAGNNYGDLRELAW